MLIMQAPDIAVNIGNIALLKGKEALQPGAIADLNKKKLIGIYFSAHWCGPCRNFTPKLVEFYKAVQEQHPGEFEVIFASSDSDAHAYDEYYATMPWLSVPFGDAFVKDTKTALGVSGIPTLTIIRADTGKVIVVEGDNDVSMGVEAFAHWKGQI